MIEDVHEKWRKWHPQYGPVNQTWNGPLSRVIYVGDPNLIRKIANENWPKFPGQYAGFQPLSGSALFAQMDQGRWKQLRKGLAPSFQPSTVNDQYSSLHKYLGKFVDTIDAAAQENTTLDLSVLHVLLTLDFVGEVAFGTELHAIRDGAGCRILQIFHNILPKLMKCGLFPLRAKIPIMKSTRVMLNSIKELRDLGHVAVRNARASNGGSNDYTGNKRIYEILALARGSDGQYLFSLEELVDNYVTFLVAGGDPTAHTLTFAVYEIIRNPAVLAKILKELDSVLPEDCFIPTIEQVLRLPYLHLVIKETLRFNRPGFGTFRYTPKDVEIDGTTLPANTTLALWNPQVHRDPQVWGEDVDEFKPERWETSDKEKRAIPGSYFPFSYGPRKCMGEGLAMLEMSLTLATLFKRYELTLEPGFEMIFQPSFTLCSRNGLPVKARLRRA
ncbi:hypothetical protein M422DRAFT_251134 [Sphaerobolus stellatus SS14]|uniref:Cytochrome P450 n=1 Tax=Sphaerobolus stellatus (strain SS14) TaxID=990650 RepID=A0A0C9W2U7_SPHS4|nr:hypothetical protein M422DRAFT_251134 [Sphaerobolus stellatus SS14]